MSKDKTIKILCGDKGLHGRRINLPIAGEVEISEDGIIEVSEEVANLLVGDDSPWSFKDAKETAAKPAKKAKQEPEDDEDDDSESDSEDNEDEEDEDFEDEEGEEVELSEIKENLEKMDLKELVKMAKAAKYPADEFKKFQTNKKLMVAYLYKKVTEEVGE